MTQHPHVLNIAAASPFIPTLIDALLDGHLVKGFRYDGSPLALADVTIYVPTRRAARELRSGFLERLGERSAILPVIRPLGEFDDDSWISGASDLDLLPAIEPLERIVRLAPLVQAWKRRLPAHLAALYGEDLAIPASLSDAIWLSRDLSGLIDEIETEGGDWTRLSELVPAELAGWWQVTLDFLQIVTGAWPQYLTGAGRVNPAHHRDVQIRAEAERLKTRVLNGPVIAAGSTGSIPATAQLLATISRLDLGAVVLPGLDRQMDDAAWEAIGRENASPAIHGHPQAALKKLLRRLGIHRRDVAELGVSDPAIAARIALVGEALRPAETTEAWAQGRDRLKATVERGALDEVTLIEAANEREEALGIAIALRLAVEEPEKTAALVTTDRDLARRVAAELRRFGIVADDSAGALLAEAPPCVLMRLAVEATLRPGDAVTALSLLKHPLLHLGRPRGRVRRASETIDLVTFRGGTGRPDIAAIGHDFKDRLAVHEDADRKPFWLARLDSERRMEAGEIADRLAHAVGPLADLRGHEEIDLKQAVRATVEVIEALGCDETGRLDPVYGGDAGGRLADFLRGLAGLDAPLSFNPAEWPDILAALIAGETVKPTPAGDPRVSIWGPLEARLQTVDTMVIGGLNEGNWPRKAEADRFMSRMMKQGLELEPPERRIGQSAHDFVMAMANPRVIVTRSARAGEAPAVASRWLQRLLTCAGPEAAEAMRARGRDHIAWTRRIDERDDVALAGRPAPKPPVSARPVHFSVTEVETLRRDPYAIYARKILRLLPVDPLLRDPGAAERGTLFHAILHGFAVADIDPGAPDAVDWLLKIGREKFDEVALPPDVDAVWWPRFAKMSSRFVAWERSRAGVIRRVAEARAEAIKVGATGVTLSGYADRIDLLAAGMADIIDFKTGTNPSKGQAHSLLAPQLALEAALLVRGAFAGIGEAMPAELAYVRLKANGDVEHDAIHEFRKELKSGPDLAHEAWERLERLIAYYQKPENGYVSRAVPFREGDFSGDYDHLARVHEWSAGGDDGGGEE
ncbi:double-strand break repair protein AddB [Aliihoeflea aestuarii]|jgi:ATP-dependent helicase/nuclease subunit B|uniref:double-strand break repair protein AddB n=1 Tax=Aliihoeflea aestuarii TaxID=453840 RepID=UPI002092C08D|nr:double-strand break repair protein AddB [Aliihoeflea aestuarii]MCO6390988.1 double-strand break repair protein AddB [Aliihoeflea aestuarii]